MVNQKIRTLFAGLTGREESRNIGDAPTCQLRFPGQYEDTESGLYYNRFRYYDCDTGQYVSIDSIGRKGGINLYAYVPNSLGWIDPFGLAKFSKRTKNKLIEENKRHHGSATCERCKTQMTQPTKSQKGVTPPTTDWQTDHIEPDSLGG